VTEARRTGQDALKYERALNLAAWIWAKLPRGGSFTFTRQDLEGVEGIGDLAASDKNFLRLREVLEPHGVSLDYDESKKLWVATASPFTAEEREELAVAAMAVAIDGDGPLRAVVPSAGVDRRSARILVSVLPVLEQLIDAVRDRSAVSFAHVGTTVLVSPWGVVSESGRWWLVAGQPGHDGPEVFLLDRIEGLSNVDDPFEPAPAGIDLSATVASRGRRRSTPSATAIPVTVRVQTPMVDRALQLLGGDAVDNGDGWSTLSTSTGDVDWFVDRLLGLRARAVVLEPQTIVDRVRSHLQRIVPA